MNLNEYASQNGRILEFSKGETVFSQGSREENIYLIQSGLIKAFYTSYEGRETVKSFIVSGEFIGSLKSMHMNEEASFSALCLKDTKAISLNFNKFLEASKKDLELCLEFSKGLLFLAQKKELREFEFLNLTPEKRYEAFLRRSPELVNQITQNDIAKYLGITPVALSRIRKRLLNQ